MELVLFLVENCPPTYLWQQWFHDTFLVTVAATSCGTPREAILHETWKILWRTLWKTHRDWFEREGWVRVSVAHSIDLQWQWPLEKDFRVRRWSGIERESSVLKFKYEIRWLYSVDPTPLFVTNETKYIYYGIWIKFTRWRVCRTCSFRFWLEWTIICFRSHDLRAILIRILISGRIGSHQWQWNMR